MNDLEVAGHRIAQYWKTEDITAVSAELAWCDTDTDRSFVLGVALALIQNNRDGFITAVVNRHMRKCGGVEYRTYTPDTRMKTPTIGENPPTGMMPVFVPNVGGKV